MSSFQSSQSESSAIRHDTFSRVMFMVGLIVAGEAIFSLPFHVTRFFRPTLLEVFGLSNTELGAAQAAYGIVAMVAYFPGGLLADRFSVRKLLAISLLSTAVSGLYFASMPGYLGSLVIWGFGGNHHNPLVLGCANSRHEAMGWAHAAGASLWHSRWWAWLAGSGHPGDPGFPLGRRAQFRRSVS